MRTTGGLRFDLDAVRELAGEKVFARGKAYCDGDQVRLLAVELARVLAVVAGTEDYRTELTGRGRKIGGTCSCPAFEDWGFCKHMVATALAANAAGDGAKSDGVGATARIRAHLVARGADALAGMIMELAERDLALFRKLDLQSAALHADDATLEAMLRRSIDAATRPGRYIDYDMAPGWVAGVLVVLDKLEAMLVNGRGALVLGLVERVLERVGRVIETMDDSGGGSTKVLERAREVHLKATRQVRPDPVQLARSLFVREMDDTYGTFAGAAGDYADVLGGAGLAEYRRLATEAWDKLPVLSARKQARGPAVPGFHRLSRALDGFMERAGDVDGRIALRAKDLSSAWSYVQLAEFCRAHGRAAEALRHAEDGVWIFADHRQDSRLLLLTAELLAKAGRKADAAAHLWRAFESQPSVDLYGRLRKLDGKGASARAVGLLQGRLGKRLRTPQTGLADVLVGVLMAEAMFADAWAAARTHAASAHAAEALARASETLYPAEAVQTYAAAVERLAATGGHGAYTEAAALVARMARLRGAGEQAGYVAALKTAHGRKRNFLKVLP